MKGVQELAAENGRVVVSGHAAEVGVVGWSMGGGHGQLAPSHGLGVDQILEVELVGADGSYIVANINGTTVLAAGRNPILILGLSGNKRKIKIPGISVRWLDAYFVY